MADNASSRIMWTGADDNTVTISLKHKVELIKIYRFDYFTQQCHSLDERHDTIHPSTLLVPIFLKARILYSSLSLTNFRWEVTG